MLFLEEGKEAGRKKLFSNRIPQMKGLGKQEAVKALARPSTEQEQGVPSREAEWAHTIALEAG